MQPLRQQQLLNFPTRPSTRPHLPSLTTAFLTLHGGISIARAALVLTVTVSHGLIFPSAWTYVPCIDITFGYLLDHMLFSWAIRLSKRPTWTVLQRLSTMRITIWAINTTISIAVAIVKIVLFPGEPIDLLWVGLAITLLMSFGTPPVIFFHLYEDRKRYKPTASTSRSPGGPVHDHVLDCEGELYTAYHKQLAADGPRMSVRDLNFEGIELNTHPASPHWQSIVILLTAVIANVYSEKISGTLYDKFTADKIVLRARESRLGQRIRPRTPRWTIRVLWMRMLPGFVHTKVVPSHHIL